MKSQFHCLHCDFSTKYKHKLKTHDRIKHGKEHCVQSHHVSCEIDNHNPKTSKGETVGTSVDSAITHRNSKSNDVRNIIFINPKPSIRIVTTIDDNDIDVNYDDDATDGVVSGIGNDNFRTIISDGTANTSVDCSIINNNNVYSAELIESSKINNYL